MRALLLTALLTATVSTTAFADQSVAGKWHADLGGGVTIDMNVTPENGWSSKTMQKSEVVRQMEGTYKQTTAKEGRGTLVFTPSRASMKNAKAEVETDKYQLANDGKELKLTSGGDTMVFEKQAE